MNTLKIGDMVSINKSLETGVIIRVPNDIYNLYEVVVGEGKLYWIEEMALVKKAAEKSEIAEPSPIAIMKELVEASEHIQKVLYSMGTRGAYPEELLPDNPHFMGKQGFRFLIDATKKAIKYIEDNKE